MHHAAWVVPLMWLGVIASCHGTPQPVPVLGDSVSIETLIGRWEGTYESPETRRSGSIVFTLQGRTDTAYGDVLMVPADGGDLAIPGRDPRTPEDAGRGPQLLSISFVQVGGNQLVGKLNPYRDPSCGCEVTTTFEGRLRGNVIEGTYTTRHVRETAVQRGTWLVKRKD